MSNQNSMDLIYHSGRNVFTTDDFALIWGLIDRRQVLERVKYLASRGKIRRVHKGVYVLGEYDKFDLAQRLVPVSYISLYTTSQMHALSFQFYSQIFCISSVNRSYDIDGNRYRYSKIKKSILYNPLGLYKEGKHTLASPERTICDMLYMFPGSSFDNLSSVDIEKLLELATIYNKRVLRDANRIARIVSKDRGAS
jgi:predicted transcriptional regulator of viral defense system